MASGGAAPIHEAHDRRDPRPRPRGLHRTESTGPGSTLGSATRRHGRRRRTPTFHAQGAAMSESHHAVFGHRSEEHTSELQSLMRNSYAVFCLKKKTTYQIT